MGLEKALNAMQKDGYNYAYVLKLLNEEGLKFRHMIFEQKARHMIFERLLVMT